MGRTGRDLTLSRSLLPITSAVGLTTAGAAATVVVGCTAGTPAGKVAAGVEIPVVLLLLRLPVEVGCRGGGHDRGLVVLEEEVGRTGPQTSAATAAGFFLDEVARWRQW